MVKGYIKNIASQTTLLNRLKRCFVLASLFLTLRAAFGWLSCFARLTPTRAAALLARTGLRRCVGVEPFGDRRRHG